MSLAKAYEARTPTLAVAPMMDWTDRHCRFFHRLLTKRTLLYTEMVVADAAIHGNRERLLRFDNAEHPIALQLGGSDPSKLAEAARIGEAFGYDEINLNVGCPSDRVQSGTFGACLMREPDTVAACVEAMKSAVGVPITVKCRIGVDEQDPGPALDTLADRVLAAGCDAIWVHARKAWLQGLSPKENRDIPPLDYNRVHALADRLPDTFVGINGGLTVTEEIAKQLRIVPGVMVGRAAYNTPMLLAEFDGLLGEPTPAEWREVVEAMVDYADRHIASGGKLNHITRHMIGLFAGMPGSRKWRRILSERSVEEGAKGSLLLEAFDAVSLGSETREAA